MSIDITVAVARGEGPTVIAAFDDSLRKVGLSSFNLIRLSSMIPPGTAVKPGARGSVQGAWGDRLYAVWSFQSAELLGQEAWAGLGWLQEPDRGRGVFVEHEGSSEAQVNEELRASLRSLQDAYGLTDATGDSVVVGTRCEGPPVCALAIAPFQTEPWT